MTNIDGDTVGSAQETTPPKFTIPTPGNLTYAKDEKEWEAALENIQKYVLSGLDTEFHSVDITSQSPVARSVVHVWSVSIPSGDVTPAGFNRPSTWVLPGEALTHAGLREWLESDKHIKAVHNQPVDSHSIGNAGVSLRGGVNTLDMARWVYPHLARGFNRPFALDNLANGRVGLSKTESFEDLFGYEAVEEFPTTTVKKRCICGVLSCRKKIGHEQKFLERVEGVGRRKVKRYLPLTDLSPSHPLWARYLAYAARDSELALIMYQVMMRDMEVERPFPWA